MSQWHQFRREGSYRNVEKSHFQAWILWTSILVFYAKPYIYYSTRGKLLIIRTISIRFNILKSKIYVLSTAWKSGTDLGKGL